MKMKKTILFLAFILVGFSTYAQEDNNDPEGGECMQLTNFEQFNMPGIFDLEFLYVEDTGGGSIAEVYSFGCHGIHYKKRCKKKDGVCGKGKMKFTEFGDLLEATVAFPDSGFTVEEPATISDCGSEISFE